MLQEANLRCGLGAEGLLPPASDSDSSPLASKDVVPGAGADLHHQTHSAGLTIVIHPSPRRHHRSHLDRRRVAAAGAPGASAESPAPAVPPSAWECAPGRRTTSARVHAQTAPWGNARPTASASRMPRVADPPRARTGAVSMCRASPWTRRGESSCSRRRASVVWLWGFGGMKESVATGGVGASVHHHPTSGVAPPAGVGTFCSSPAATGAKPQRQSLLPSRPRETPSALAASCSNI